MRHLVVLLISMCTLLFQSIPLCAAPIHDTPAERSTSGREPEGINLVDDGDDTGILERLGLMEMVQETSFYFSEKEQGGMGPRSAIYQVDLYTMGVGGIRRSILGFDRGVAFDRGTTFDQGIEFDEGVTPDKGAKFDEGAGFDGLGDLIGNVPFA